MRPSAAGVFCAVVAWLAVSGRTLAGPPALQSLVDATPEGGLLQPAPGTYAGPIVIRRPIRIDGAGAVTIDGGGRGSVIRVLADDAELRGLHVTGSGSNHDTIDAGVQVRGNGNIIEDNSIDDTLFGIDLHQADGNVIRGNTIQSKDFDLGVRGDGIRLWYSRNNQIVDNHLADVRDMVVWYSADNLIAHNTVTGGRYALHFMYSEGNRVEANAYQNNTVGIFLMYSDGVEVIGNRIVASDGMTGMGIGFKESSDILVEANAIVYCAKGIYLDISPYQPDTRNRFKGNWIAYNGVGVLFHSDWHGNEFLGNDFDGNFTQVAVQGGGDAEGHLWEGNRWDDYRGFDRDGDGVGDTAYDLYAYSDRIWMELPEAAFFRGSPLFEAIDFLDRLAPFSEPTRILHDPSPHFDLELSAPLGRTSQDPTSLGPT